MSQAEYRALWATDWNLVASAQQAAQDNPHSRYRAAFSLQDYDENLTFCEALRLIDAVHAFGAPC
jgi:hypothetical protein